MADLQGLPTRVIRSDHLEVEVLAEAGPRIVRVRLAGRENNLLAEVPDLHWPTPRGEFRAYGGHRLWTAPESAESTYYPDNLGVTVREDQLGLRLTGARETSTGLLKSMVIALDPRSAALSIRHSIINEGSRDTELSPWAITQLPLGGQIFLPQTVGPFPGDDPDSIYRPNRHIVFWNYAQMGDLRLDLAEDHLRLDANSGLPPVKLGQLNTDGWAAYLRGEVLFIKRFSPQPDKMHPDRNCNIEIYCGDKFVELETLGPLTRLGAGQSVELVERWEFVSPLQAHTFVQVREAVAANAQSPTNQSA
jgi:hypothetical protein